jgi:inositol oxygenase
VLQDTFVVGCAFSDKNIYPETFAANPDAKHPVYSTTNGIYEEGCGMENIMVSWGHDEVGIVLGLTFLMTRLTDGRIFFS